MLQLQYSLAKFLCFSQHQRLLLLLLITSVVLFQSTLPLSGTKEKESPSLYSNAGTFSTLGLLSQSHADSSETPFIPFLIPVIFLYSFI